MKNPSEQGQRHQRVLYFQQAFKGGRLLLLRLENSGDLQYGVACAKLLALNIRNGYGKDPGGGARRGIRVRGDASTS